MNDPATDQTEIKPNSEWGCWVAGVDEHIDTEECIRIIAQHPDGDWIFERLNTGEPLELETMNEATLRGDWRPLPFRFTAEYIKGWLEKIEASRDDECARGEEEKLYRGVLETLLVYPLEEAERRDLILALLDRSTS